MEALRSLLARYGSMGALIFVGFLLFIYAGLVVVYLQQDTVQAELKVQIDRTEAIAATPLADPSELEAEAAIVRAELTAPTRDEAIKWLVDIVAKHGVDINPEAGKLVISPNSIKTGPSEVGGGSYQIMSFEDIRIQSSYANVMALIDDLDAGATKETVVLTSLEFRSPGGGAAGGGAEGLTGVAEFNRVQMAVTEMMADNNLTVIPNPIDFAGDVASNDMAAFPDSTSGWLGSPGGKNFDAEGDTYRDGDAPGYVLYDHDNDADGLIGGLVDYMGGIAETGWFYTCEADGTVQQFLTAEVSDEEALVAQYEVNVVLSVDIYSLESEETE